MSSLHLTSSQLSRFAYILDGVLCTKIGNPVVLSIVAAVLGTALTIGLIMASSEGHESFGLKLQDHYLHLIHNVVNLVFISRFPSNDKDGLVKKSNKTFESVFFVLQNFGILLFFVWLKFTFMSNDYSKTLRVFMQCQIICPYAILVVSLSERYFSQRETEKEVVSRNPKPSILAETNNNMLPIFMANSFAYIKLGYPLADAPVLVYFNNIACFCLKFTLIHRFILHGIVVINGDNAKDYAELYRPVTLGNKTPGWGDYIRSHETSILKACTIFLIVQDIGVISLLKLISG